MPVRAATILHVDMDAFYASVEVRDDPRLAGLPVVVGGTGRRGVVASCSYEARAYGVRSAMPSARARQLCPHAVFVAGRHGRYAEVSGEIHDIFHRFTPVVEGVALDEAFLDVTGAEALFGPAPEIAAAIRRQIGEELGLGCSVGVAPVKFLAKLASEAAKPTSGPGGVEPGRGVVVVAPGEELRFLHPHPVEALWGVGPATAARLRGLGITTVGDLAAVPPAALEAAVGRAHGAHLHDLAWGRDDRAVEPDRALKSVSHEETYATDRHDPEPLGREIVRMADAVASRLRKAGVAGRTVTLKVRYGDFTTITRSKTAAAALDDGGAIAACARALLDGLDVSPGVRLLGVGVSNLLDAAGRGGGAEQLALDLPGGAPPADRGAPAGGAGGAARPASPWPAPGAGPSVPGRRGSPASWQRADEAVDAVRRRFGDAAVGPAALLGPDGLRVKRSGDTQWGPAAEDHGPGGPEPAPRKAGP